MIKEATKQQLGIVKDIIVFFFFDIPYTFAHLHSCNIILNTTDLIGEFCRDGIFDVSSGRA